MTPIQHLKGWEFSLKSSAERLGTGQRKHDLNSLHLIVHYINEAFEDQEERMNQLYINSLNTGWRYGSVSKENI